MSERINETPEQQDEFERLLSQLQPVASSISRDALMYEAGRQAALQKSVARPRLVWPLATAASWLITLTLGGMWALAAYHDSQPMIVQVDQPPVVDVEVPTASVPEEPTLQGETASARSGSPKIARTPLYRHAGPFVIDDLLDPKQGERLSMVGWSSLRSHASSARDDVAVPVERLPESETPATYRQLMKLYLDDQTVFERKGDLL
ncbi:MAG: hypothetical protein KDA52_10695 [Planctomycetaceae bacterium]|nr:hypothetical protein [Planctomycetaceae bacterium]